MVLLRSHWVCTLLNNAVSKQGSKLDPDWEEAGRMKVGAGLRKAQPKTAKPGLISKLRTNRSAWQATSWRRPAAEETLTPSDFQYSFTRMATLLLYLSWASSEIQAAVKWIIEKLFLLSHLSQTHRSGQSSVTVKKSNTKVRAS